MRKEAVGFKGLNFTSNVKRYAARTGGDADKLQALMKPTFIPTTAGKGRVSFVGGQTRPGSGEVFINPLERKLPAFRPGVRETIAHEAFHANNPIFGESETLARFYGGFHGVKGRDFFGNLGAGIDRSMAYLKNPPQAYLDRGTRLQRLAGLYGQHPGRMAAYTAAPVLAAGAVSELQEKPKPFWG